MIKGNKSDFSGTTISKVSFHLLLQPDRLGQVGKAQEMESKGPSKNKEASRLTHINILDTMEYLSENEDKWNGMSSAGVSFSERRTIKKLTQRKSEAAFDIHWETQAYYTSVWQSNEKMPHHLIADFLYM